VKGKETLSINYKNKDDVKVEDNQDELIVTPGNINIFIHMVVNYLEKDETYEIEASENPNMFCIYLITRKDLISVNHGDTWKRVKKYIDETRPNTKTCSICYEPQCRNIRTCSNGCVVCCMYYYYSRKEPR